MKHNYAPETALFAGVAAASAAIATSEAEWTVDATDSASIERHVNALSEGLMRRLTAQGILPHRMELIYLLQDGDASDNRDALRRWITRQLANATDVGFDDRVSYVESRLRELLQEAQWC
ncbi:MAG: hypothetical protein H6961_00840 [Chromatiaceae bacterium]|nr:hypothetical protein [Chromatiaceae bacterium]